MNLIKHLLTGLLFHNIFHYELVKHNMSIIFELKTDKMLLSLPYLTIDAFEWGRKVDPSYY